MGSARSSEIALSRVRQRRRAPRPVPTVTGRLERHHDGTPVVTYRRVLDRTPDEVWSWLSDRGRLSSWLGDWREGERGERLFRLSADDAEAPEFAVSVELLGAPHHVGVAMYDADGGTQWQVEVHLLPLVGERPRTELVAQQVITDPVMAPSVGSSCEFFLDRLVLMVHGESTAGLDFDEYFLAQAPDYRQMFPLQRGALNLDDLEV